MKTQTMHADAERDRENLNLDDIDKEGVVTEISQASFVQDGDVVYNVRIAANDAGPHLRWEMTAVVIFEKAE